jgi:hypothetical protein
MELVTCSSGPHTTELSISRSGSATFGLTYAPLRLFDGCSMAVNQTFHPCEKVALDPSAPPFSCLLSNRPLKYTAAVLAQPRFFDSYLSFRMGQRHRPDQRRPYASLAILVLDALKSAHESSRMILSPRQLMDAVVLFPANEVSCLVQGRGDELVAN